MRKVVWIPILITALVLIAFATANLYRVPTFQHRFIETPRGEVATVRFVVDGVRCRGTSAAFAQMIGEVPGLVSVTTYARTHEAIVEFEPLRTSPELIVAAFTRPVERDGVMYRYFELVDESPVE